MESTHGPYVHRESGRRVRFPYKARMGRWRQDEGVEAYAEVGPDDSIVAVPPVPAGWLLWNYEGDPGQYHPKDIVREAQARLARLMEQRDQANS